MIILPQRTALGYAYRDFLNRPINEQDSVMVRHPKDSTLLVGTVTYTKEGAFINGNIPFTKEMSIKSVRVKPKQKN